MLLQSMTRIHALEDGGTSFEDVLKDIKAEWTAATFTVSPVTIRVSATTNISLDDWGNRVISRSVWRQLEYWSIEDVVWPLRRSHRVRTAFSKSTTLPKTRYLPCSLPAGSVYYTRPSSRWSMLPVLMLLARYGFLDFIILFSNVLSACTCRQERVAPTEHTPFSRSPHDSRHFWRHWPW